MDEGQQQALRGRSGSGKSTLLNLVSGLLKPDSGTVRLDGQNLSQLSEAQRDRYRGRKLGYVFQSFHLLQGLTVWENLWLAAALTGRVVQGRLEQLLHRLDLGSHRQRRPQQLSIGQQQRVAVARALVNQPRLVLADEPTGNLDAELAQKALKLLQDLCSEYSSALLLVSHDQAILSKFERVTSLTDLNRASLPC
ncbi:ABC transporter ATP-binding protein [bacterium]|nr:ABC transporter ATP-binding protein [bacterium]